MSKPADPTDEAPLVPDASPTLPPAEPPRPPGESADIPYLPAAEPITPPVEEHHAFDAKAMVEATTIKVHSPAYGGLPNATEETLEATQKLRAEARRKRRRNRMLAWFVAVAFLGGVVAAGWFAYRAYQDDQDRQAAERAAAEAAGDDGDDDEGGVAPGALTPLGNQQAIIETMDELNSGDVQPSGGGLRDIVDRAQEAVDGANAEAGATGVAEPLPAPTGTAPPPRVGIRPDYRTLQFVYRRSDGAAAEAPSTDYTYYYDTELDEYFAFVRRSDSSLATLIGFTGQWTASFEVDGSGRRSYRSELSLEPEPDTPLAAALFESQALPVEARPFAAPIEAGDLEVSNRNGRLLELETYVVDIEAFRRAAPEVHRGWVGFWNGPGADHASLLDPSVSQVPTARFDGTELAVWEPLGVEFEAGEPNYAGAIVSFARTEGEVLEAVVIIDPVDDFRAVYVLNGLLDEPDMFRFDDFGWVDEVG